MDDIWDDGPEELVSKNIVMEILKIIRDHVPDDNKTLVENAIVAIDRLSTVTITYRMAR